MGGEGWVGGRGGVEWVGGERWGRGLAGRSSFCGHLQLEIALSLAKFNL